MHHNLKFVVIGCVLCGCWGVIGRNGEIEIVECTWDGTRIYFEEGVRQSQANA